MTSTQRVMIAGMEIILDEEDVERVTKLVWYKNKNYIIRYQKSATIYLHHFLLGVGMENYVDHKDGDPRNNSKSNLRECTSSENNCNRQKVNPTKTTSKYKGVYQRKIGGMWDASIKKDGKKYNLGVYITEQEAALAYNKKAKELHGEFAVLNEVIYATH